MSKKRKNFHYHYAERYETQHIGDKHRGRRMPVPPLAFFVSLVVLMLFGLVTTSFSAFVTSVVDDPAANVSGGLIVKARNEMVRAANGVDSSLLHKEDAALAGVGADADLADTSLSLGGKRLFLQNKGKVSDDGTGAKYRCAVYASGGAATYYDVASSTVSDGTDSYYYVDIPAGETGTNYQWRRCDPSNPATVWNYGPDTSSKKNATYLPNSFNGSNFKDYSVFSIFPDGQVVYVDATGNSYWADYDISISNWVDANQLNDTTKYWVGNNMTKIADGLFKYPQSGYWNKNGSDNLYFLRGGTSNHWSVSNAYSIGTGVFDGKNAMYMGSSAAYNNQGTQTTIVLNSITAPTLSNSNTTINGSQSHTISVGNDSSIKLSYTRDGSSGKETTLIDKKYTYYLDGTALNATPTTDTTYTIPANYFDGTSGKTFGNHTITVKVSSALLGMETPCASGYTLTVNQPCIIKADGARTQSYTLAVGEIREVAVTAEQHDSTKSITVTSPSPDYVKVSSDHSNYSNTVSVSASSSVYIKAMKPTSAAVVVSLSCSESNNGATVNISVSEPTLSISTSSLTLYEGESDQVSVSSASPSASYSWTKFSGAGYVDLTNENTGTVTIAATQFPANSGSDNRSATVRLTATYSTGYTKTLSVSVTAKPLPLSVSNLSIFEGHSGTITPSYGDNPPYTPTSYSWTKYSGNTSLLTLTDDEETVTVTAGSYPGSSNTATVRLSATYSGLNLTKVVDCTVTVNEITMSALTDSVVEGGSVSFTPTFVTGAPTPAAYGAYPAYHWSTTDTSKITLANEDTGTVTVNTKRLANNVQTNANVSLTVYYSNGFNKTFTNKGTVKITKSPYYLLGVGDWTQTNEARRMIYYPAEGTKPARYSVDIELKNLTANYYTGDRGFKVLDKVNDDWYAESGNATATIDRNTQGNGIKFDASGGYAQNTGVQPDREGYYTFYIYDIDTSNETMYVKIDFPMGSLNIYTNIDGDSTPIRSVNADHGETIKPTRITSQQGFIEAQARLEDAGYVFNNTWESSDPNVQDPLYQVTDPDKKIYAIFVPKSLDINVDLQPHNRLSGSGKDGTTPAKAYEISYGSAIKAQATLDLTGITHHDNNITYSWYWDSTSLNATGTTYTSLEDTLVSTIPAGSKDFTLVVKASCTDALNKTRNAADSSETVYYKIKSAFTGMDKSLGGTVLDPDQKIYSTAPDLTLKIFADLRAFDSALNSTTPVTAKETSLFAKTIELLRYKDGAYSESMYSDKSVEADPSVPDYKAVVPAQAYDDDDGSYYDTTYGAQRGVNYLKYSISGDSVSAGEFRTVVGTNSNYPTRPLYFENNSGTSLENYRVMLFYYDTSSSTLVYQTAQVVDEDNDNLYRFEIPKFKTGSSNTWDGNVWIAAFKAGDDDKYDLPSYDGSAAASDAKLSFTGVDSILYARTVATSVEGKRTLVSGSGGINTGSKTIAVS